MKEVIKTFYFIKEHVNAIGDRLIKIELLNKDLAVETALTKEGLNKLSFRPFSEIADEYDLGRTLLENLLEATEDRNDEVSKAVNGIAKIFKKYNEEIENSDSAPTDVSINPKPKTSEIPNEKFN